MASYLKMTILAGVLAETCRSAAQRTTLDGDYYVEYGLNDAQDGIVFVYQWEQNTASWMRLMLGSDTITDGTDVIEFNAGGPDDMTGTVDGDATADATDDITWGAPEEVGSGLMTFTVERPLDTSDADDYVIPADSVWTLGWQLCTTSGDLATAPNLTGSI